MLKTRLYILLWGVILIGAMALRLPNLQQRPMHTDEAVHAFKLAEFLETKAYRYDADEYHGPTLYYFTSLIAFSRGQTTLGELDEKTLRLAPVLFGLGLILLLTLSIPLIGKKAALAAALWLTVSPVQVFYSRYFIQEVLFVFFGMLFLIAVFRYGNSFRYHWALLAGCSLGLLHATKETDIILLAMAAISGVTLWFWEKLNKRAAPSKDIVATTEMFGQAEKQRQGAGYLDDLAKPMLIFDSQNNGYRRAFPLYHIAIFAFAAFALAGLLLSSFFQFPQGFLDSFKTYAIYLQRGAGQTLHLHPWYYYLQLLFYYHAPNCPIFTEAWLLPFAIIGMIRAFRPSVSKKESTVGTFRRFLVLYTLGLALAYSAIPYKTPWNLLSFHFGLLMLAGIGLIDAVELMKRKTIIVVLFAVIAIAMMSRQTVLLNDRYACAPCNPWAYAHPGADVEKISQSVAAAAATAEGFATPVNVIATNHEYWPLPWTLRRLPSVGWYDRVDEQSPAAPIILATADQEEALLQKLYRLPPGQQQLYMRLWEEYRELRPGVEIRGYMRKDLWDAMRAEE